MIDWNEYFYYDETSPSRLRWNTTIRAGKHGNIKNTVANSVAGYVVTTKGRSEYKVKLNNKVWFVHRIIWEMFNERIPEKHHIDHINGESLDNNIENLRCIHFSQNARNKGMNRNNISGVTGVSYRLNKKTPYWVSQYNDFESGKLVTKSFNINKYGYDEAFSLACEWRQKMILELNAQGTSYTNRHGR